MQKYATFSVLLLWRLISVFVVQTAHVPDEYWQSLEVAHKLTFGYGYLTWEWNSGIRSYLYPFLISLLYQILKLFHLDYVEVLIILPRVFQAFLSGYGDYCFYLWTNKSKVALFCLCFNWYWYYCATRTLINSFETALTMIALSIFPWRYENENNNNQGIQFLWIVGFLCIARPTAAIIWLPLCLYYFFTKEISKYSLAWKCLRIGSICLLLSTLIDVIFYGKFLLTPWEFLKLNVIYKISDFYGENSLFWYLTSGIPTLLGLQCLLLPPTIWKILKRSSFFYRQTFLLFVIVWTIVIYSLLSHKEFRFILPLLPMFIYITTSVSSIQINSRKLKKLILLIFCLSNLIPCLYFSMIHQRGSLDVMKFLRRNLTVDDSEIDLLFLTPCHANPIYSHIHRNISVRFLTCEPNLSDVKDYLDEADQFFMDPLKWLNENFVHNDTSLPSHLIIFDNAVNKIAPFLFFKNYSMIATIFYSHFPQNNYGNNYVVFQHIS